MADHETRVSTAPREQGQRRTLFYAICTCGWVGQSRATRGRAADDGMDHEIRSPSEQTYGDRHGAVWW